MKKLKVNNLLINRINGNSIGSFNGEDVLLTNYNKHIVILDLTNESIRNDVIANPSDYGMTITGDAISESGGLRLEGSISLTKISGMKSNFHLKLEGNGFTDLVIAAQLGNNTDKVYMGLKFISLSPISPEAGYRFLPTFYVKYPDASIPGYTHLYQYEFYNSIFEDVNTNIIIDIDYTPEQIVVKVHPLDNNPEYPNSYTIKATDVELTQFPRTYVVINGEDAGYTTYKTICFR